LKEGIQRRERSEMDENQKRRLGDLFARQHVAVIVTQGGDWPTATLQAFAETPELDLLFIMGDKGEKFDNLKRHPRVSVLIDGRDTGDVSKFMVDRALVQGTASEIARGAEWEAMKAVFIAKNPFEAPFFGMEGLRMIRVRPERVAYTGADRHMFKIEF
jgi:nitroimidazol reductase NimA-like FMN-containing flavoprotein (pyridoxamine 5'-phosphate oxidase superfamily)